MASARLRLLLAPLSLFAYVTAMVVTLALVHPFSPEAPRGAVELGDAYSGGIVYEQTCAGCHGEGGKGGGVGPPLAGRALDLALASARIDQGAGAMPPALVAGRQKADVLAYLATLAE
ncbi:MAG: c-type cytochrome [Actinobacteria bacterium]|nr:c-type cytochrome [Actinomycetota bacterium]